jgi:propionyl-CoA carboxylase alpha chain
MFKKILIANRGEIACRIIKTARRIGIACVAAYSEADRRAPFVALADEAICIGAAPAAQSYLLIENILAACRATGAEAVHPGYGFLSESAAFAEAVAEAGLVFIGPNLRAIALMGDKLAAKELARAAGVAVLPGSDKALADLDEALAVAEAISYPVMLKPSAGGGGKGMRIAYARAELENHFAAAQSEAAAAFGDARLFIEKFVRHPRHIEIQLLGDHFGNLIHLGERECSIQRRHQKIIEEAPSPFVDETMREAMAAHALALARAVNYDSAGTVEFLVDPERRQFHFLEMNTRLQVEHPVTELVTGLDLVEEMLKIAAGERLRLNQADVRLRGVAIESRIYAEDPSRGFLPSTGRLVIFEPPQERAGDGIVLRHDSGVIEGSEISIHYDPMIGKLITHAETRAAAIATQADALDQFVIDGIGHNIAFLATMMQNARFKSGALATDFIASEFPTGFVPREPTDHERALLACVAAAIDHVWRRRQTELCSETSAAHPPQGAQRRSILFGRNSARTRVDVSVEEADGLLRIAPAEAGRSSLWRSDWRPGQRLWCGTIDGAPIYAQIEPRGNELGLAWRGIETEVLVLSPRQAELAALMPEKAATDLAKALRCPMPGLVKVIGVGIGQAVRQGELLCIIEAMKMETILRADMDAVIKAIHVCEGASLGVDAIIMEFE